MTQTNSVKVTQFEFLIIYASISGSHTHTHYIYIIPHYIYIYIYLYLYISIDIMSDYFNSQFFGLSLLSIEIIHVLHHTTSLY